MRYLRSTNLVTFLLLAAAAPALAQMPHVHDAPSAPPPGAWHLMQDGVVVVMFNDQGGPRGGREAASQNWWMGMAHRRAGRGTLQFNLMLSLEPAFVGADGYRELFQTGETFEDRPLVDRQHPHDFVMQAAAAWRTPLGKGYELTLSGGPVAEAALGPVPFMHRASAFENPTAPLSHHTFDSTHIAMGVVTAGLSRGRWQIESSIFHGGESDEQRWDLMDPGPLDSWSVRGWFRPTPEWTLQASHGFLNEPEAFDPTDVRRTTASAEWRMRHDSGWTAAMLGYGLDSESHGRHHALLAEGTHVVGRTAAYTRIEIVQVNTDILRFGTTFVGGRKAHVPDDLGREDSVGTFTVGGVRTLARPWGLDIGAGADVTFHAVPGVLRPTHGEHPVSYHLFVRVRGSSGRTGRGSAPMF
jgi:hypothetical protein